MRLVCPSCAATYDVPDELLGSGPRRLRCARCAHEWTVDTQQMPPPAASPPADPPPRPGPPPLTADAPPLWSGAPPPVAEARRRAATRFIEDDEDDGAPGPTDTGKPALDRTAMAAWTASVLLLVGLVVAVVAYRADLMRAWPQSQRLFALFEAAPR